MNTDIIQYERMINIIFCLISIIMIEFNILLNYRYITRCTPTHIHNHSVPRCITNPLFEITSPIPQNPTQSPLVPKPNPQAPTQSTESQNPTVQITNPIHSHIQNHYDPNPKPLLTNPKLPPETPSNPKLFLKIRRSQIPDTQT